MWPGGHLHNRRGHSEWRRATFVKAVGMKDLNEAAGRVLTAQGDHRQQSDMPFETGREKKKDSETLEWSLFSILSKIPWISSTSVLCPPPLRLFVSWGYSAPAEYGYPIAVKCLTWVWNLEITAWTLSGPADSKGTAETPTVPAVMHNFLGLTHHWTRCNWAGWICVLLDMCVAQCVCVCVGRGGGWCPHIYYILSSKFIILLAKSNYFSGPRNFKERFEG